MCAGRRRARHCPTKSARHCFPFPGQGARGHARASWHRKLGHFGGPSLQAQTSAPEISGPGPSDQQSYLPWGPLAKGSWPPPLFPSFLPRPLAPLSSALTFLCSGWFLCVGLSTQRAQTVAPRGLRLYCHNTCSVRTASFFGCWVRDGFMAGCGQVGKCARVCPRGVCQAAETTPPPRKQLF